MIFDSSAWIEFFSASSSPADIRVTREIERGTHLVVLEPILMELMTGTTNESAAERRRLFFDRFTIAPYVPMLDSEQASAIHRACRRGGETIRNLIDCQIAAMAIRLELTVLHRDRDFEAIARHTPLETIPLF